MEEERDNCKPKSNKGGGAAASCGSFWIAGWMFTLAFVKLSFWKAVLGLIIWPWYLGHALHGFLPQ